MPWRRTWEDEPIHGGGFGTPFRGELPARLAGTAIRRLPPRRLLSCLPVQAALIAVGTELLGSDRLESNTLRVAELLERCDIEVRGKEVLPDDEEDIARAIRNWRERVDIVVLTGGLGPTADDVTREALARAVEEPLIEEASVRQMLEDRFARWGREPTPNQFRQALRPVGAEVLPNRKGTAPGLWWSRAGRHVVLLPGVPAELEAMLEEEVLPRLEKLSGVRPRPRKTWILALEPEGDVDQRLRPLYGELGREQVTVLASPGLVRIRVTWSSILGPEPDFERVELRLRELLGEAVFPEERHGLEGSVIQLLRSREETLGLAESCTGGGIGSRLTQVPGASTVFVGGIVAYDNSLKTSILGVSREILERFGAVSQEVVEAMALGAIRILECHWSLAVSGIAGPGGGSAEKPVGTVVLAMGSKRGLARTWSFRFPGERERVRELAAVAALELLRRQLAGIEGRIGWSLRA